MLPLVVLAAAVYLRVESPVVIHELRLKVFDAYQSIKPREFKPEETPSRIVDIDEESLRRFGQWPWPRPVLAELTQKLTQAGAALIVFDVVFAEPDRTSPTRLLKDWQKIADPASLDQLRTVSAALPDHDDVLAQTLAQTASILGFVMFDEKNEKRPAKTFGMAMLGDPATEFVPTFSGAAVNLPVLSANALGEANFNSVPDSDNIVRRVPLFVGLDGQIYPTLVAETLRIAQGASTFRIKSSGASGEQSFGEKTGITAISIGDFEVPTDNQGAIWLYDTGHQEGRYLPVWKVMEGDIPPGELEGRVIFIGTSAEGLRDIQSSPLSTAIPGVELHVQALEQIFSGALLTRPDWADGVEILGMIGLGLIIFFGVRWKRVGASATAVLGGAAAAGAIYTSWYMFDTQGLLLDPIYPMFAGFAVYLVTTIQSYMQTESEKKQIRGAFAQYMSPDMVAKLADNPSLLQLGGEMRDMTLLFCDVRGFTTISEQFNAQELTAFINKFLTPMTDIIMERNGTIDKYMGDCIMAFWNAPLDDGSHADHGVESAMAMMARLTSLNEEIKAEAEAEGRKFIPLAIGIGLNTGVVCVGNMGSDQRFDYSVLGDDVNLAARLEGQSKTYGVDIVIGANTLVQLTDKATLELDLIQVKGKTEPVRIHCVAGGKNLLESEKFNTLRATHEKMLSAYAGQRWDEAFELLDQARKEMVDVIDLTVLYELYEERLTDFKANPPGEDWDGVFVATSK
jgi:adenylate cyclase